MTQFVLNQDVAPLKIVAKNFAQDSENRMHSDKTAAEYGYKGGLVPGVAAYGYMTCSIVEALGRNWLSRGSVKVKFIQPIYHDETLWVRGKISHLDPLAMVIELCNVQNQVCATGEAGSKSETKIINIEDYPEAPLPTTDERPEASFKALAEGSVLGSLNIELDIEQLAKTFVEDINEPLPLYRIPKGPCHPAYYLALANEILSGNVKLGPWLHAGSEVQHFALPKNGELLSLRGKVAKTFSKKGHDFVVLDLGLFGEVTGPIAWIQHTAIIRPRMAD